MAVGLILADRSNARASGAGAAAAASPDRSNAMASGAGAAAAAAASPEGSGHEDACSVLLDVQAYIGASKNASTARSKTSTGHTIEVTFCIVPPPALSHISVHCPDLQLPPDDLSMAPQVVATTDDLIVLRVPIDHLGRKFFQFNDYFVYRAHPQDPKLDLLPNPQPYCFRDQEIAILSCGSVTADGGSQYVVASLKIQPSFTLHLYRSKPGGEAGSWTVHPVSVENPLRDSVCPIPDTAQRLLYHLTTSVITLGGANGTVGWVDLWRGILLCNVLEERPKLRDIPLPLPAKGNWRRFLRDGERFVRDITVSQRKNSIKYVEMEIIPPKVMTTTSSPDPATYLEWVHHKECLPPLAHSVVPGQWKATTWSMPIPVTSWDDWRSDCTAESHEFHVSDPRHHELLQELMNSSGGGMEAKQTTLSLGSLHMGYPAFSIDDDVVYLSCKAARRGLMGLVAAVDVRKKELRGVAKLDIERNTCFMRSYIATEVSKYLKTTDESLQEISSAFGPTVAKVVSDVATECVCSSGMDDSVMLQNVTSGTAVPSLVDIVELSPTKTHEINMVGTTNDIDKNSQNEKCDTGLTSHQGNEMHITDNLEEKELNQEVIVDTIPPDANVILSTDSPEENEQNEESIAGTNSGKIDAVQRVTSIEEFEVNVASKESNVTSVIAMAEEKKQDEVDMKNHEIEGACRTQATGENNTPTETNAGTVTDDVEDKMPNEEIATGTFTHITDSSISEGRMDNGEVTEGLGSNENIVVHGSENVEGKMYKEARTSPTVDKSSLPNSTEVVEERKDGKTCASPSSHETNVAHTMDSVDKKNEQTVDPTSNISTVGMGNAEDKHSEETAADPSSVENATTTQVTDTEDAEKLEQNENTISTGRASDEEQVAPQNTKVTDELNRATYLKREMANMEMPTSSDNKRSTSTDPASDKEQVAPQNANVADGLIRATDQNTEMANKETPTSTDNKCSTSTDSVSKEEQVAQSTHVTDGLNQATSQNREMAKEMPTSFDNKPSTSTDPVLDESQVAKNSNVPDVLNRAAYQNREMANQPMPTSSGNKLPLKDLLAMEAKEEEAKEKENKRSSFRRWYLKTTCRS